MIVIIGSHIPKRVRGVLQIWLLEPKPNVFIGSVNKIIENKILIFIQPYINNTTDIMVIRDNKTIQGFSINYCNNIDNKIITNNSMYLKQKIKSPDTTSD
jgi:CRISPR-associated protein Cas2